MTGAGRFILLALVLLVITPLLCGQNISLSQGVRLVMNPLEPFSRSIGLRDEKIQEAARTGITGAGLKIDESSGFTISVRIVALAQVEEDLFPFRVEVHGGTSRDRFRDGEKSPDEIGDIPAVKNISIPWNDDETLLSATRRLAKRVALELRKEIGRRGLNRR